MDRPAEIDLLCRLCLVKDRVDIPIFEEQGDIRQIFLKISCCLPISISLEDSLPKKICDNCSIKLDSLYDFWNCTVNAEKTLLTWLGQAGVKDAGNTITAVAQQIAKPESQIVKVEDIPDLIDGGVVEDDEEEERPQKRARRSAAVKAQETIANVVGNEEDDEEPSAKKARSSVDEDDSDEDEASMKDNDDDDDDEGEDFEGIEPKMEDEGDESEGEVKPTFDAIPGTSAQDQPGPSGVGKIEADAPFNIVIKQELENESEHLPTYIKQELNEIIEESDELEIIRTECGFCDAVFKHEPDLLQHVQTLHVAEKLLPCNFCKETFSCNAEKDEHMTKVHKIDKHSLLKYMKQQHSLTDNHKDSEISIDHVEELHPVGQFVCDVCDKSFTRKPSLNKHRREQHLENPKDVNCEEFICCICDKSFENIVLLDNHVDEEHSGHKCPICNKTIKFKANIRRHIKTVHAEKQRDCYECVYCGLVFQHSSRMNTHMMKKHLHYSHGKFTCNFCPKSFIHSYTLKLHVKIEHSDVVA